MGVCHMKTKDSERLLTLRFMFPIVGTVLELGSNVAFITNHQDRVSYPIIWANTCPPLSQQVNTRVMFCIEDKVA